jgi:hypothetical protein
VVLWYAPTNTAAAYLSIASPPNKDEGKPRHVTLRRDKKEGPAPFLDKETASRWDIAGRAVEGKLKGWTLTWLDGTQVKWFAWSAEHPGTSIYAKSASGAVKTIAGSAEFLRSVPKHFATLQAVDPVRRRVTLLVEGEMLPKVWQLVPDAEIKLAGWWGRLDQLRAGDRVWTWFKTDRRNQPVAVCMLADELSEQDIHGDGVKLESANEKGLQFAAIQGRKRLLQGGKAEVYRGEKKVNLASLRPGERLYFQSAGGKARLVLDPGAFELRRAEQKAMLRKRWISEGLPGAVAFVHLFSGEMELMVDHEAMRWGRSLEPGDRVTLLADPPIPAVVKHVAPWRERTRIHLVVRCQDLADMKVGERMYLRAPPPLAEVDTAALPPDMDRPRSKAERIEWFLASIYCTCAIGGDGCTGHFYTLASCNPNGCGMPNHLREVLAEEIKKGLTDKQIFEKLLKEHGPTLLRPHLAR